MGADLYINSKNSPDYTKEVVSGKDKYYFRDSYNNSDLLWQFDLSWWTDIGEKYGSVLTPEQAQTLLFQLEELEPVFKENMKKLLRFDNPKFDYTIKDWETKDQVWKPAQINYDERKGWVKYFKDKYKDFKKFLELAIQEDVTIDMSL